MGHDFSFGFSKFFSENCEFKKDSKGEANSTLISKAQDLGINVSRFCTYDENGTLEKVDTAGLNAAIAKATQEQKKLDDKNTDTFSKRTEDKALTDEEKSKAKNIQDNTDDEYKKALMAYAGSLKNAISGTAEADKIKSEWNDIKEKSNKYIGVDASETTVLEGAKEFINTIQGLVNTTKNSIETERKNEQRASIMSLKSEEEYSFEENKMETYGTAAEDNTNPFADISFKSAMNTFYQEDEEKEEIAA